jgi:hypothetical protein
MQSDRQLRHWYAKFNRLYWNEGLPVNTVLYWEPSPGNDAITCPVFEVADGCFVIKLDPAIKGEPNFWKMVLLHEMVHVAIWQKHPKHEHGKVFINEKDRIYELGALKKLW